MALVAEMPVKAVAELVGEEDKKIWRIVHHYVDRAVEAQDLSGMERLGIDDTSFRRGQSYVSVFADLDPSERRAVFVAEGRDQETVEQFAGFLAGHGGEAEKIAEICQDMSGAYLAGVREHFKRARGHLRPLPRQAEAVRGDRRGPPRGGKAASPAAEEHALPVAQAAGELDRPPAGLARSATSAAAPDSARVRARAAL